MRAWVGMGVAALALGGCYDPEEEFEKFEFRCGRTTDGICAPDRLPDASADAGVCSPPDDDLSDIISKRFIAISSGIPTAETFPTMLQVEYMEAERMPDRSIRVVIRSRPVAACDPTTPVDDFSEPETHFIQEDGTAEFELAERTLPAEANPILPAPIRSQVTLTSKVCEEEKEFQCGTTRGQLFEPIMQELSGTFGQRIVQDHGEVPDPLLLDCFGTVASPISEFPTCMSM